MIVGEIYKLINKNIEYSKKNKNYLSSGDAMTGLGKRNILYNHPYISEPWKLDKKNPEATKHKEITLGTVGEDGYDTFVFENSHWLDQRVFEPNFGLLTISFNPITTNHKPPIILGLVGSPVTKSFVAAFDRGIYSKYFEYEDSHGAFYKEYIAQYTVKGGKKIKNKHAVFTAVGLEDLEQYRNKLENKELRKRMAPHDVSEMNSIVKFLLGEKFRWVNRISKLENFDKHIERYIVGKMHKVLKKRFVNPSKKKIKQLVKKSLGVRKKGIMNKVNTKYKSIDIMQKEEFKKMKPKRRKTGFITSGEEIPSIWGQVIYHGVKLSAKAVKNAKLAEKYSNGKSMDAIQIAALKKTLKKEIKNIFTTNGIDKMLDEQYDKYRKEAKEEVVKKMGF